MPGHSHVSIPVLGAAVLVLSIAAPTQAQYPAAPTTPAPPAASATAPLPPVGPGLQPEDGKARAPARGTTGVDGEMRRLTALAEIDRPLPTTYRKTSYAPRALTDAQLPFNATTLYGYDRDVPRDSVGVRMHEIDGTLYNHPVAQAQDGLMSLSDYRITGAARDLARAAADAQRLIERRVGSDGGSWYHAYPFDFELHSSSGTVMRAPWFSGMAQGQVLSLFTRMYQVTGELRYRNAAAATFRSFLNAPVQGRPSTVNIDPSDYLWIEEYPVWPTTASDRTLNGHVFGVFGLYEWFRLEGDQLAADLWNGGLAMPQALVPSRFRDSEWVSRYCLAHPEVRAARYHEVHRQQLLFLHASTGDAAWSRLADNLRDDYPPPDVEGTAVLIAGAHTAYRFDANGAVTASRSLTLSRASSAPADRRERIIGRGYYLRITAGGLAGYLLPESYVRAYLGGIHVRTTYPLARTVILPAGERTAYRYSATGAVTASVTIAPTAATSAPFTDSAVINARLHVLVSAGALSGYWLPTAGVSLS
jgi:hypothetical protein